MIFRKPYAFLIKYFKLINLILGALSIYLAYKVYNIITFFNEYVIHDYSGNFYKGFSNAYISPRLYTVIILILIGIFVIYLLFIYKKKPTKAYLSSGIYYIIILIFLIIIKNLMISLESSVITAETARIFRDLAIISIVPQIFFIILFLLRGLGFNIGKFKFKEDLKELQISEQDSEEVEITFKNNGIKLQRVFRRFIREFKYYIKENKFIFIIICLILVIVTGYTIYKSIPETVDASYKQGDTFVIGNLNYIVEDSIITNLDYKGDTFENTYYLVVKLLIENTSTENEKIDYNDFRLIIGDNYFYPVSDKGIYFIDYAVDYTSNIIKASSKHSYSLIFKIENSEIQKNYEIKISSGSEINDNLKFGRFNYVTITPIVINKINVESSINLGEELSLKNSNLGNSSLQLSNAIITDKYIYDYEICYNDECKKYKDIININYTKNNKLLIIMDYKYTIDENVPYYDYSNNINSFITSFCKIKFKEGEEVKYATIKNVTPSKLKDKIVLETTNEIKKINELYLSITIRNKEYEIKIK